MIELRAKVIRSSDNSLFKQLKRLASSPRARRELGQTLLDGAHLITALADSGGQPDSIALREGNECVPELEACVARFPTVPKIILSAALFDALAPTEHSTGLLAQLTIPKNAQASDQCAVLLETIQDPGNMGSMLRTAAAAGVDAVYLSAGCAEAWSPKALRGGMGAQFALAIHEGQDLTTVARGFDTVVATSLDATKSIFDADFTGRTAFLFGNEGVGLSAAALAAATLRVRVPMAGTIESLNVAAAAAVCLFERVRQLGLPTRPPCGAAAVTRSR